MNPRPKLHPTGLHTELGDSGPRLGWQQEAGGGLEVLRVWGFQGRGFRVKGGARVLTGRDQRGFGSRLGFHLAVVRFSEWRLSVKTDTICLCLLSFGGLPFWVLFSNRGQNTRALFAESPKRVSPAMFSAKISDQLVHPFLFGHICLVMQLGMFPPYASSP